MQLKGDAADNPDQRITEDVKNFVEQTLTIGLGLLSSIVTLFSFVIILWGLSNAAPLHLFGADLMIPGYLCWVALVYAIFGTALTHWIGAPLVNLNFEQQRYEADFRFNLVRVRENSEQIALLKGESAERGRLLDRFGFVIGNWYAIMSRTKRLTAFTASYQQAAVIFPYVLVAPAFFAKKIQLGDMMQTASAFSQRAGRTVVLRDGLPVAGGMALHRLAPRRLRDVGRCGREPAAARAGDCPQGRRRQSQYRPRTALREPAERHAAGRRRRLRHPDAGARVGDRTVGLRQVDAVPGHRRHLAVRHRHHLRPRKGEADDAAPAPLFPGRRAA